MNIKEEIKKSLRENYNSVIETVEREVDIDRFLEFIIDKVIQSKNKEKDSRQIS